MNYFKSCACKIADIKEKLICIKKLLIVQVIFSILLYLVLIANQLTNQYDGLWNGNYYLAGEWELSIGRWLWIYIDRLRWGISSEPTTTILTLVLISVGNLFLIDIFGLLESKISYLVCLMILSSTTVCNWISYRYMSPTFGSSYLLSVLAGWFLTKGVEENSRKSDAVHCLMGALLTAGCLGCYQATLACTCLVILLYFAVLLLKNADYRNLIYRCMTSLASLIAGCLIYKAVWDIHLKMLDIEAASYKGANSLSIRKMILAIPQSTRKSYGAFYNYFFKTGILHNIFQKFGIYYIVFVIIAGALTVVFLSGKNAIRKLLFMFLILALLPVASNASIYLTADADIMIQMTAGMAIVFPCLLCVVAAGYRELKCSGAIRKAALGVSVGCAVLLLYGNIYMVATDVESMYEGKAATETLVGNVITELQVSNQYDLNKPCIFVGRPGDNLSFCTTENWARANAYAQYGMFWTKADCLRMTYNGVLRNLGVNLSYGSDDAYQRLVEMDEVKNMPIYPSPGYIREIDGHIVIKISDTY